MRYTKEEFIDILGRYVDDYEDREFVADIIDRKLQVRDSFEIISDPTLDTLFVSALEKAMDDREEWISWWIYETNCGKDSSLTTVTSHDGGKKWELDTVEALYDFLAETYHYDKE